MYQNACCRGLPAGAEPSGDHGETPAQRQSAVSDGARKPWSERTCTPQVVGSSPTPGSNGPVRPGKGTRTLDCMTFMRITTDPDQMNGLPCARAALAVQERELPLRRSA